MPLFQKFLNHLSIKKDKIVFVSYLGRGWGCNPKYIAAELLRQKSNYDLVWLVSDKNIKLPKGIRPVELFSRRGRYELATAKVIISNVKRNLPYTKKKGQYYIQTWHGDFPLKFIEKEAEDTLSSGYLAETKADSEKTNLILSGSMFFSKIIRESFWYDGEIMESGLPRNDIFFKESIEIKKKIRVDMGVPAHKKIALYAPTFRDNGAFFSFPSFDQILNELNQFTGKEWIFVIRLHPNDQHRSTEISYSSQLLNGSIYHDMQELEVASDLLITDYSSVMYDFAIQKKPVILFTPDLDEYRTNCRNLRPLYDELPFVRVSSDRELQDVIPTVFNEKYLKQVDDFLRQRVCFFDDGHASERVVNRIHQVISKHGRYN